jgi:hypothetical protein
MKKIIVGMLLMSSIYSYAQEEIIIIDRSRTKKTVNDNMPRRMVEHMQVFKFDPLRMSIGEINFSYERALNEYSSVEVELGPTISNLGRNRFSNIIGPGSNRKISQMGIFASAAFRFYPLDDRLVFNQLYISPKIKFRQYNEITEYNSLETGTTGMRDGSSSETIFTFNFGYQQWLAERFSFDYYFGVGIGGYRSKSYSAFEEYNGNTNSYSIVWQENKENFARFVATIGIKVGIGQ